MAAGSLHDTVTRQRALHGDATGDIHCLSMRKITRINISRYIEALTSLLEMSTYEQPSLIMISVLLCPKIDTRIAKRDKNRKKQSLQKTNSMSLGFSDSQKDNKKPMSSLPIKCTSGSEIERHRIDFM